MPIEFSCACGKSLRAPDGSEGRRAKCPKCGAVVTVPAAESSPDDAWAALNEPVKSAAQSPADDEASSWSAERNAAQPSRAAPALAHSQPPAFSLRNFAYLLLALALIPLVLSVFHTDSTDDSAVDQVLDSHPELLQQAKDGQITGAQFKAAVLDLLPDHRVPGALLAYDSNAHWLIGLGAAAVFFVFLLATMPQALRSAKGMLFAGIFTGTVGVILLLAFQWAAENMPLVRARGIIGLILLVVKLIGLSYSLAEGDTGWFLSFIGFTCGVGLCEEATKAIPLLFRIKPTPGKDDPTWNNMLVWGLASGVGFGIAEGIMYAGRSYNGISGPGIYYVRFFSCVALHAMWAGAVGISVYRNQQALAEADGGWAYCGQVVLIILVPMILHGLYDTLLKKEMEVMALAVALASFGWLVYQVERQRKAEPLRALA